MNFGPGQDLTSYVAREHFEIQLRKPIPYLPVQPVS